LTDVLNAAHEHVNRQMGVMALSAIATRYFINTSTDQAEKMALMAYVGAQKGNDRLWQLVSGKLLAGTSPKPPVSPKRFPRVC
jgi:hypothetical protein